MAFEANTACRPPPPAPPTASSSSELSSNSITSTTFGWGVRASSTFGWGVRAVKEAMPPETLRCAAPARDEDPSDGSGGLEVGVREALLLVRARLATSLRPPSFCSSSDEKSSISDSSELPACRIRRRRRGAS